MSITITKKILSDQVLYRLSSGNPDAGSPVDERDIWNALEQKTNAMFKLQMFTINMPNGETVPPNMAIAEYDNIPVVAANNGKAKSQLPVIPISIPRSAGINEVRPVITLDGVNKIGEPMIPLIAGQASLLDADSLLSDMFGQLMYEHNGMFIVYNKDIRLLGVNAVNMKLVVLDISQYGINDILPIPADYEAELVEQLYQEFLPVWSDAESGKVNVYSTAGQQPINSNRT